MKNNIEQDAQYAAELDADASRDKLAKIYATALIGACKATATPFPTLWEEYDSFLQEACDPFPKFEAILASPSVSVDEKIKTIDALCRESTAVFRNFLKTLAKRSRFDLLRDVRRACRQIENEARGLVPTFVTTATAIDEATKLRLVNSLRPLVNGEPVLSVKTDPSIIGGVIVRVGDVIYDASIATQLHSALQDMINRSAHEIQSRRDSFRHSEGN